MVAKNAALVTEISTDIFYPETDGMPLPDGPYQSRHFRDLLAMLELFFRFREDVMVGGDVFIYYVEGNPRVTVAPDCFVVIGVSEESFLRNNTYLMWEVGKAPDFVLEIGSPSTWRQDLGPKRDLYASLGVGEYWMFDPSGGEQYGFALRGERLVDGEYQRIEMREDADGSAWGYSPTLNLELHWVDGRLRLYDPEGGRWLQNIEETAEAIEAAKAAMETERAARESAETAMKTERAARESAETLAQTERAARESAEARLAEMEAELRRLHAE